MKKIIVFGTGKFYQENKKIIKDEIVAFIDNDISKIGSILDKVTIITPESITNLQYDYILLMANKKNAISMRRQLIKLGISRDKILFFSEYIHGEKTYIEELYGDVLIISNCVDYDGGSMVVMYLAQILSRNGFRCVVVIPNGNVRFIEEMEESGINIKILPYIPYLDESDLLWINKFRSVIVNVLPMYTAVSFLGKYRKLIWWLHESFTVYQAEDLSLIQSINYENVKVIAVSEIAKRNFDYYIGDYVTSIMPYGIPDMCCAEKRIIKDKCIIAVIGTIQYVKGQDIFVDAIDLINPNLRKGIECWLIGGIASDDTAAYVMKEIDNSDSIKYLGKKSRSEMKELFSLIDVVVMPSREDCLPIAIMEGLMNRKVCLVSDNTGIAAYITHKKDGLVFNKEDARDLAENIEWIIKNKDLMPEIGDSGRRIYERGFTLESFGRRVLSNIDGDLSS